MPKVTISSLGDDLYSPLAQAIDRIGGLSVSGDTVLIKPNLVLPVAYETGEITNPYLVEATVKWCFDHGARKVIIGEGPGYYQPVSQLVECFTKTGIKEVAERTGAQWVLFDEHPFKTFRHVADCTPSEFRITTYVFDCDKIINMPVMKTHYLTTVTLAMKNLKGCLKREDKPKFHHIDIYRAIVELNKIIRPSLNVVDGTVALRPVAGAIVVGTDVVAVDSVSCSLMGIDPKQVRTVLLGAEAGLGEMNLTKMDISAEELKRFKVSFALPKEDLKRRFPLLKLIGAEKACSGCLIPLLSALSSLEQEGAKMKRTLSLVVGKDVDLEEEGDYIFIGDCTNTCREKGTHLEGCPPDKEELIRRLREAMSE
jgi:uncharacterized protein (DUF362 family)